MGTKGKNKKCDIFFVPISHYLLFCALVMVVVFLGGGVLSLSRMLSNANSEVFL